ncbi:MAG: fructose-bisphosphate aldolase [Actinobacteria bacterium]|nr:fructose-bisphosphate aldolase [Actinomycetota bacterium]
MTVAGKEIRLKRLIQQRSGTSIICALDHGMTSPTFFERLVNLEQRVQEAVQGGANVIMMSKGMIERFSGSFKPDTSFAMLLTASALGAEERPVVRIGEVEEALRHGADAVVVFVALGGESEPDMIRFVARVGEDCERLGIPFIAEAEFPTTYAPIEDLNDQYGVEYLLRNVRLCVELGADIVKTNWSGDQESFARVVAATSGVPVVLAGGSQVTDMELLTRMRMAIDVGAIGCSIGRNIFLHDHPEALTRALARVIREGWSAEDAMAELKQAVAAST